MPGRWFAVALVSAVACSQRPQPSISAAPAAPTRLSGTESVGAVEVFGQGVVALGQGADRVLVELGAPAYIMLVRFDSSGTILSGAASPRRYSRGSAWLEVPAAAGRARHTSVVTAPAVCDDLTYGVRRTCRAPGTDLVVTAASLLPGESLLLFLTAEPFGMVGLEERLNAIGRRPPIPQLPGLVMAERTDLWAAYLVRR